MKNKVTIDVASKKEAGQENISPYRFTTKMVPVRNLTTETLPNFYHGMPYRYNSVTDLVFQKPKVVYDFLSRIDCKGELLYRVDFINRGDHKFPLLECLELNGVAGGMLSSYLHDFDRCIIEGEGKASICYQSKKLWKALLDRENYSFVFKESKNRYSRTSEYMHQVGFQQQNFGNFRCFFNGRNEGESFLPVMREFISAIEKNNKHFEFNLQRFSEAKSSQRSTAIEMVNNLCV